MRRYLLGLGVAALGAVTIAAVACSSAAPPAPTAAPTKAAAPAATTAPAAPAATTAPAAAKPTAASPAASTGTVQKPADWPKKSIQMIIPWNAGGGTDVGFRLLAPLMEKTLGQSIEVVNKTGAGSQVGITELAKAKPDGYTIGNVSGPATQTIYLDPDRKAVFKWEDFAPIGLHVFDPGIVTVAPDSKYKSLKDVIDDAKANPEKVKVSTTGILGDDHLAILELQRLTGVKFAIVHFDGAAPAKTALLGGHTDVAFNNVSEWLGEYKSKKARPIAVLDEQRSKFYPDVPTSVEQGFKLLSSSSRGLAAPKGTPKEIVNFISYAMEQAMKDPSLIEKMESSGLTQRYMNPEQFDKYMREIETQAKPLVEAAKAEEKK
ncbi:MAG: tripartite tricarboxylate transporter substrate binding protein [Sphingomonadaceae bacterium]